MEDKNRHQMTIYFTSDDLLERVRESAKKHRRSTSAEALWLMETQLDQQDQAEKPKRQRVSV